MHFRLYNTMTRQIEPFSPADPARVTFYSCGPTVYDDAHIGNFRAFLAADLLRRWIESPLCTLRGPDGGDHAGPRRVLHVMNVTDVGHMTEDDRPDGAGTDKMVAAADRIREAKKAGKLPAGAEVDPDDPRAVAAFFRARFVEDAIALGLKVAADASADPTVMPDASGHVDAMKKVIARLLDDGAAYAAGTPGARAVYFDVRRFEDYGRLSGNTIDQIRGGAGGRVDDAAQREKRHPADFLLWKEDAAHKMKWPAPDHPATAGWGPGYPGWHIECTAMALERLAPGGLAGAAGASIDLHSGGEDNIFPHHECEIAQSRAFTGAPAFARHWFHTRFLMVDGQKMSKSRGTFFTPRELMARGHDPAAIRLELIKTHYRANADFSLQGLKDSARMVDRWRKDAARIHVIRDHSHLDARFHLGDNLHHIADALSRDLNISAFIERFNKSLTSFTRMDMIGTIARLADQVSLPTRPMNMLDAIALYQSPHQSIDRDWAALHIVDGILGVIFRPLPKSQDTGIAVYLPGAAPSDEVEALLAERRDARAAKDFARSDAIRDRLRGMGYAIKDAPGGRVEVGPA